MSAFAKMPGAARRARFEVTEVPLFAPWVSAAHEGLRIAQLSDLHIGPGTPGARVKAAVQRINELCPDLAVITGDFVTLSRRPVRRIGALLSGLRVPTYVVLGNHDHVVDPAGVRRELERLGYTVLQNSHAVLHVGRAPIVVVGVDDGYTRHDDVEKAFNGAPPAATRLVLAHTPTTAQKLPPHAGLICFSGHTHGGQVPEGRVTKALWTLARQPYVRGLHEVNGNLLYVNRGLCFGLGSPLFRVRCPPELSVFTLTREGSSMERSCASTATSIASRVLCTKSRHRRLDLVAGCPAPC